MANDDAIAKAMARLQRSYAASEGVERLMKRVAKIPSMRGKVQSLADVKEVTPSVAKPSREAAARAIARVMTQERIDHAKRPYVHPGLDTKPLVKGRRV